MKIPKGETCERILYIFCKSIGWDGDWSNEEKNVRVKLTMLIAQSFSYALLKLKCFSHNIY